jgi:hypothetical protein
MGRAQADPFGAGDGGELALRAGGDLDGPFQSLVEGLDLGPLLNAPFFSKVPADSLPPPPL